MGVDPEVGSMGCSVETLPSLTGKVDRKVSELSQV